MEIREVRGSYFNHIAGESSLEGIIYHDVALPASSVFDNTSGSDFLSCDANPLELSTCDSSSTVFTNVVRDRHPLTVDGCSKFVKINGSLIPIPLIAVETPTFQLVNGKPVIVLNPDEAKEVLKPETPSHILDHMYAKKYKEPGSLQKPRKRIRKKESLTDSKAPKIKIVNKDSIPGIPLFPRVAYVSDVTNTKVNIIRKTVATTSSGILVKAASMLRPKIRQNPNRTTVSSIKESEIATEDSNPVTPSLPTPPPNMVSHLPVSSSDPTPTSNVEPNQVVRMPSESETQRNLVRSKPLNNAQQNLIKKRIKLTSSNESTSKNSQPRWERTRLIV